MFRTVRWYSRELERRERAWSLERAELIGTICHLAGKPLPTDTPPTVEPQPDPAYDGFTYSPEER